MSETVYQPVGVVCSSEFQASRGQARGRLYLILALHGVIKTQVRGVGCQ